MQDSKEKQCLIFVRNNANDTADRIEAYAKKSGMEVVETVFNTDKKAVERLSSIEMSTTSLTSTQIMASLSI